MSFLVLPFFWVSVSAYPHNRRPTYCKSTFNYCSRFLTQVTIAAGSQTYFDGRKLKGIHHTSGSALPYFPLLYRWG